MRQLKKEKIIFFKVSKKILNKFTENMSHYGKLKLLIQKIKMKIMKIMIVQSFNQTQEIQNQKIIYMKEKYLIEVRYPWVKKLYLVYVFCKPYKKQKKYIKK